ncbi:MAG: response regulator transcription factor [Marmoricola sp.]
MDDPGDGMQEQSPLKLLIVDDHEVVREGLQAALERESRYEVVAVAGSAREALNAAKHAAPDVVILDMRLPDSSGDDLCRKLRGLYPELVVLILSTYLNEEIVRRAIQAGAAAYVTKAAGLPELRAALDAIWRDRHRPIQIPSAPQIVSYLERLVKEREDDMAVTPQQTRVLELAAEGLTYRGIAERLFISESTVRFHIQKLKVKFGAATKTDLIVQSVRMGIITVPADEAGAEGMMT